MDEAPPERPPIATAPLSAIFYVPPGITQIAPILESWLEQLAGRAVEVHAEARRRARRQNSNIG